MNKAISILACLLLTLCLGNLQAATTKQTGFCLATLSGIVLDKEQKKEGAGEGEEDPDCE